jgi:DNA-binding CsgD family transcriptional regulator
MQGRRDWRPEIESMSSTRNFPDHREAKRSEAWLGQYEPSENHTEDAEAARALAQSLGFLHFILIFRMVIPVRGAVQVTLHNWPSAWFARYWERRYFSIDPIVQHMIESYAPFDWNDLPTLSPIQEDFYEEARQQGFVDGVSGSVRFGSDQLGLFTVSSDRPLNAATKEEAKAWLMLFTAQCFDRVRTRILKNYQVTPIVLTRRQIQALWGISLGLSLKESGDRMGISVSGVQQHLDAARRKLGEETSAGAARKAIALDLMGQYEQVYLPEAFRPPE